MCERLTLRYATLMLPLVLFCPLSWCGSPGPADGVRAVCGVGVPPAVGLSFLLLRPLPLGFLTPSSVSPESSALLRSPRASTLLSSAACLISLSTLDEGIMGIEHESSNTSWHQAGVPIIQERSTDEVGQGRAEGVDILTHG